MNHSKLLVLFLFIGFAILISACDQLPAIISEPPQTLEQEQERLTESDFAIFIGRKSGLITYLGPNGNIFTVNQAGRNESAITSDSNLAEVDDLNSAIEAVYYLLPTWSTNGRQLAYAQHRITNLSEQDFAQGLQPVTYSTQQQDGNRRTSIYTIFAADENGQNKQELWSGTARPIYMYWAPDEITLSVLLQEPGANALHFALLSTEDEPATSDTLQVVDVGGPLYWDWAPHGKQIMTHIGSASPTERISLLSLETEIIEELFDVKPARFASPDISPNGHNVMLPLRSDVEGDDDTWISIINLATRKKSIVEKLDGDLFIGGSFSPDSSRIAYIASTAEAAVEGGELAVYTLGTGDLKVSEAKNIIAFFWSPDSTKIAWFELMALENDDEPGNNNRRPRFGLHIFDVASQKVVELIQPFQTSAQFNEVLTFYSQYQRSATIWSPDSNAIVLPVRTPEGPVIITMDVSGEIHPRTIAPGVLAFWSAE